MNSLNQYAVYLFVSGDAFFVGLALIALGRAATWHFRRHRTAKWLRLLTILGLICLVLSMTPLPWWLYGLCLIPPLVSLNVPFRDVDKAGWPRLVHRAQPIVELILLGSVTAELVERHRLYAPRLESLPAKVHVIGDSLSAGIANEQERLWPTLLASEWSCSVRNQAQVGATTASAMRQAEAVLDKDCVVLIEIGGNDFFEDRTALQIEVDLDRLLTQLASPRRTLVMFELPLPPSPGAYDLARLQRRLAHRHAVRLIPRRGFAKVLLTPGTTSDGLHLTPIGHRALASLVSNMLSPRR